MQLFRRDFAALTSTYSYAVAHNRPLHRAVEEDLDASIRKGDALLGPEHVNLTVKYFQPNDISLYALIECLLATRAGAEVLVEFVVTGTERMCLSLEQISPCPRYEN